MSHTTNVDARIHSFIASKINRTMKDDLDDLFSRFGDRDASIQNGETIVGMKYEPASRGKF